MQKILLFISLLIISNIVSAQSNDKQVEEFLQVIKCSEFLNHGYESIKNHIDSIKEELFIEYQIDFGNKAEVAEFDSFLMNDIEYFRQTTYNDIKVAYWSKYTHEEIQEFLKLAKDSGQNAALLKSNFANNLDSILQYNLPSLLNDVHLELIKIRAKQSDLILKIIANGKETEVSDWDVDLLINTNDENLSQFSILNKSNAVISLPENFDFEKVTSLIIQLDGKNYVIERYNMNFLEMIRKVSSPLTLSGFKDLEFWILTLTDETICLKIKNETCRSR
ncbi:MAG: hypothetical protein H6607_12530 [Flavobacteriales bacterium]|nr:hypothetical protein [Flavobacteriales bacterium]